jgi:S-DNA-T family DNA segregation ATPase FtsK/SpoIIIE
MLRRLQVAPLQIGGGTKELVFWSFLSCVLLRLQSGHDLFLGQKVSTGGLIGIEVAKTLKSLLGIPGTLLLILPVLAVSIMILSRFSFILFAGWSLGALRSRWANYREKQALNRQLRDKNEPGVARPGLQIRPRP